MAQATPTSFSSTDRVPLKNDGKKGSQGMCIPNASINVVEKNPMNITIYNIRNNSNISTDFNPSNTGMYSCVDPNGSHGVPTAGIRSNRYGVSPVGNRLGSTDCDLFFGNSSLL